MKIWPIITLGSLAKTSSINKRKYCDVTGLSKRTEVYSFHVSSLAGTDVSKPRNTVVQLSPSSEVCMLNCLRRLPYCWNFTLLNVTVSPKLRASHCRLPPPIGASLVFCHVPLYWNAPGASPLLTEADAVSLVLTLISARLGLSAWKRIVRLGIRKVKATTIATIFLFFSCLKKTLYIFFKLPTSSVLELT